MNKQDVERAANLIRQYEKAKMALIAANTSGYCVLFINHIDNHEVQLSCDEARNVICAVIERLKYELLNIGVNPDD